MNTLRPIEHKNQRVLTTQQIAEGYGTDAKTISYNFNHNIERYQDGKHFYCLEGEELKQFKTNREFPESSKINKFYLWTEKGALLHAKSLNTDKAWQVYELLVDTYFKTKDLFTVPQTLPDALRLAADLAEKIEQDRPKVLFAETCMSSNESILIRELAKVCSKRGKTIGQNNLFRQIRKWGLLSSNNEPYQEYIERGYFEVIERPIHTSEGTILKLTTKVLPKGQTYIFKRLEKEAER
jgi:phage antirepressor YoqD-like protein